MEKIIDTLPKNKKPTLLLQVCCAPCSSHCLTVLTNYFHVTIYYYNPNIYPLDEYNVRAAEIGKLLSAMELENKIDVIIADYRPEDFYHKIKGYETEPEGGKRCKLCFELRLAHTASYAKKHAYDYFTTSLTISPHKNAALINHIGFEIAELYQTSFLPADFKKKEGYKHSIALSKEYGLYRQDYCGCKFSLSETEKQKERNSLTNKSSSCVPDSD